MQIYYDSKTDRWVKDERRKRAYTKELRVYSNEGLYDVHMIDWKAMSHRSILPPVTLDLLSRYMLDVYGMGSFMISSNEHYYLEE